MASFALPSILEKMGSRDTDYRFMACSDLLAELGKDSLTLDVDGERKLVNKLMTLLEDKSGDVQGLALKCLGGLARRAREDHLDLMVQQLAKLLQMPEEAKRDVAAMALKTVIESVPPPPETRAAVLVRRLSPMLLTCVQDSKSEDPLEKLRLESLDILNDLCKRFVLSMGTEYDKVVAAVLPQLTASRATVRKRVSTLLATIAPALPDALFTQAVEAVLATVQDKGSKAEVVRSGVATIGAISRTGGVRLGKHLARIVPLVMGFMSDKRFESDDELRDSALQTLEALVLRCRKEVAPHIDAIVDLGLVYVKHDPNFDDGGGDDDDEGSAGDDSGSDVDYDDDEDVSWKVRRSSARLLAAVVTTRSDRLAALFDKLSGPLISRFREREETVKLEVFATYEDLLRGVAAAAASARGAAVTSPGAMSGVVPGPVAALHKDIPRIVKVMVRQLGSQSTKTRSGVFHFLAQLIPADGPSGELGSNVAPLLPPVTKALAAKAGNQLRLDALSFLRHLLAAYKPAVFQPSAAAAIVPPVVACVGDKYYKITAEALRVVSQLVLVIRPTARPPVLTAAMAALDLSDWCAKFSGDATPLITSMYTATLARLKTLDIDQEVKDAAIDATGWLLAQAGDLLAAEVPAAVSLLNDRLRNEITRMAAVQVFARIAKSPLKIDVSAVLTPALTEISTFLRKSNRPLRQASLVGIDALVSVYASSIAADLFATLLKDLSPLISDQDLHLAHLALQAALSIARHGKDTNALIDTHVMPAVLALLKNPLLQGTALTSVLELIGHPMQSPAGAARYNALSQRVLALGTGTGLAKQSLANVAQAVAVLAAGATDADRGASVKAFVATISDAKAADDKRLLALYSIGEIGRRADLSAHAGLENKLLDAIDSPSEDVKTVAALALGNLAVGSLPKYLPLLLSALKSQPGKQYLLLHSLKEVISRQLAAGEAGAAALKPFLADVLAQLFAFTQSEEEGTRNVLAECLGKLAIVFPGELIAELAKRLASSNKHTRSTVVSAIKYAITPPPEHKAAVDAALSPVFGKFLALLSDPELEVRRTSLLTLNYAAHNAPALIRDQLKTVLPVLYTETMVKPDLIHQVALGPFKHTVDDGLESRKAAFTCMQTLLDTCPGSLDISEFIAHLASGLKDEYDIKMLCHGMLIKLTTREPIYVLQAVEQVIEPLRATIVAKNRAKVKQLADQHDDMVRSALRAVLAISKIPDVSSSVKFQEFMNATINSVSVKPKYAAVVAEAEGSGVEQAKA